MSREGSQDVTQDSILAEADEIFQFEKKIAEITVPDEDRRNTTEMYNPMTIKELSSTYPGVIRAIEMLFFKIFSFQVIIVFLKIDWDIYFFLLFGPTDIIIDATERVIVVEPEYLEAFEKLITATPARTIGGLIDTFQFFGNFFSKFSFI